VSAGLTRACCGSGGDRIVRESESHYTGLSPNPDVRLLVAVSGAAHGPRSRPQDAGRGAWHITPRRGTSRHPSPEPYGACTDCTGHTLPVRETERVREGPRESALRSGQAGERRPRSTARAGHASWPAGARVAGHG